MGTSLSKNFDGLFFLHATATITIPNLRKRRLREEPESDGSSPDEGAPGKNAGHRGTGKPVQDGVGYVQRDFCDGQSLASPGRWTPSARVYPSTEHWNSISGVFQRFTVHFGSEDLFGVTGDGKKAVLFLLPTSRASRTSSSMLLLVVVSDPKGGQEIALTFLLIFVSSTPCSS